MKGRFSMGVFDGRGSVGGPTGDGSLPGENPSQGSRNFDQKRRFPVLHFLEDL